MQTTEELIISLSNNFKAIIPREEIRKYPELNWGDNGLGNRWANKKYNYTSVYSNKTKRYSENDTDRIPPRVLKQFRDIYQSTNTSIIGIFVHSIRLNRIVGRPIRADIRRILRKNSCVSCGTFHDITCDHKNDLYNDSRVLKTKTQILDDFQTLCRHCNLQKRQIVKEEIRKQKLYSAKNLDKYKIYPFDFPWEKKIFDVNDKNTKKDTYWYDPIEFNRKVYMYMSFTFPIISEIKRMMIHNMFVE